MDPPKPLSDPQESITTLPQEKEKTSHLDSQGDRFTAVVTRKATVTRCQLAILCLVRFAEVVAYYHIISFADYLIKHIEGFEYLSDSDAYGPIFDASYSVPQILTAWLWGSLSDGIGRRRALFICLVGTALASASVGFAASVWHVVALRFLLGAFSGTSAIVLASIGETTDGADEARAYAVLGIITYVASVIAPPSAAWLTYPNFRYPETFGGVAIFIHYPFALPGVVSCGISNLALLCVYFFFGETRIVPASTRLSSNGNEASSYPLGIMGLLRDQQLRDIIITTLFLSFISAAFETLFGIWTSSTPSKGGLGQTPLFIGLTLLLTISIGIIVHYFVLPRWVKYAGAVRVYKSAIALWPVAFALMAATPYLSRLYPEPEGLFSNLTVILLFVRVARLAFPTGWILVRHAAPNGSLGSAFGLAQTASMLARAPAPYLAKWLFNISAERQILAGNFVWLVAIEISIHLVVQSRKVE